MTNENATNATPPSELQPQPLATGLSFKLKEAAPKSKVGASAQGEKEETDYVKGLSGSEVQSVAPKEKPKVKVIAPLKNTWDPYGKNKSINPLAAPPKPAEPKPAADAEVEEARKAVLEDVAAFEAAQKADGGDPENPAFRKVREMKDAVVTNDLDWTKNTGKKRDKDKRKPDGDDDPMDEDENDAFKRDMEGRPDEATLEEYQEMPIEDFGVGMLRSMGWDGGAIGGQNKGLVEPVMFVPRGQGYAGLGSDPRPKSPTKKKFIKPGESREAKPVLVAPLTEDGKVRNYIGVSEKLVKAEAKQVGPGARVEVVEGKHKGVYAVVVKIARAESGGADGGAAMMAEIMLANGERLTVLKSELELVDRSKIKNDVLEKKSVRKDFGGSGGGFQGGIMGGADVFKQLEGGAAPKRPADGEADANAAKKARSADADADLAESKTLWLLPDIRVRVVSQKLNKGKLYNKKARIVDVIGFQICTIQMEETHALVDEVKQRHLETVLPKPGGTVLILSGSRKGQRARLIEKSNSQQKLSVQFFSDMTINEYHLDDAAEYLGGVDDLAE